MMLRGLNWLGGMPPYWRQERLKSAFNSLLYVRLKLLTSRGYELGLSLNLPERADPSTASNQELRERFAEEQTKRLQVDLLSRKPETDGADLQNSGYWLVLFVLPSTL